MCAAKALHAQEMTPEIRLIATAAAVEKMTTLFDCIFPNILLQWEANSEHKKGKN